ncbi:hypothetical protein ACIPZF_19945 [Pseudomonas sp. NPDC089752]|uniref:calcium-binding protein n=1 Tax=Pseudomonas sp. NPDC089752 TaxID=3364472 RepID=UPI003813789D
MSLAADDFAPHLVSLIIPNKVDLSSGVGMLTVGASVSDEGAGVKSMQVWFDKSFSYGYTSGGSYNTYLNLLYNQGSYDAWSDGSSSQTWFVAASNLSGAYNVVSVVVEDFQGNTRSYSAAELMNMGANTSIAFVNSMPDVTPPKLLSLLIPREVDLSSGAVGLEITAAVTDDISGIKNLQVWFDKEFSYSYFEDASSSSYTNLIYNQGSFDSFDDGFSSQVMYVSQNNLAGTYNVTRVVVEDFQGNVQVYTAGELAELGVNTSIDFKGSKPDVTPPKLLSLVVPGVVDISADSAGLTVAASVVDDQSGVKSLQVWFDKSFAYSYSQGGDAISFSALLYNQGSFDSWGDGYSAQTWFPAATNPLGVYSITSVVIEDFQGNSRIYLASELAELGVNTSVRLVASKSALTPADDYFIGRETDDWVWGGDGNDKLYGVGGDDVLEGGDGNDILDGGVGADKLIGGLGHDTYYVDSGKDMVVEASAGGIDTVISSVSRTLGANQENLILTGTAVLNGSGNGLDNTLTGNGSDNVLNGAAGADRMIGGLGDDTYYVDSGKDIVVEFANSGIDTIISSVSRTLGDYQENLILSGAISLNGTGNSLDNKLTGNRGDNVLIGGAGADTMTGGLGNDTYHVDSGRDIVVEYANGGIDTVIASVSRTLGDNQENLTLSGNTSLNATGNNLDNILKGNSGNNVLNGGSGADTMVGGQGDDTYYVDSGRDVVLEMNGAGIDTVVSSVSRTLGENQENLVLYGDLAINGTGNRLDNALSGNRADNMLNGGSGDDTLWGGGGNDRLVGGAGKDILTGGSGNDIFSFNSFGETGIASNTWDVITDFEHGKDKIDLSAFDANTATSVNDAFNVLIGSGDAFTLPGQLKFAGGMLYGNANADNGPDFAIQLVGVSNLTLSDFVL